MMPTAGPSAAGPSNPQIPPVPSLGTPGANMIPGVPVARNLGSDYNPDSIPKPWGEPTIPAIPPRPSAGTPKQATDAIVAVHAAAAAAAVAAAAAPNAPAPGATTNTNYTNMNSGNSNTNQDYSNGTVTAPNANGHAEYEAIRAAQMKRRKQLLDECVERNRTTYRHPKGSQEETIIFHRARALLDITNLSQTFICQRTNITNAALSQYLRACFKGRQDTLEDKLEVFIIEYLEGKYDGDARKTPVGRRKSDSSAGPSRRYSNPAAVSHMATGAPNGTHAGILSYQHRMAQQHLIHQQHQQQAMMRQHQPQHQHQYAAAAAAAAAGARGHYKTGATAAGHYANQRAVGQAYNRQYQQQYALQQALFRQQQQQQQQAYQNQLALQYRRTQVARANAAAAAQAAAPTLKPLPPTVAVEKAFHAYQSANLDITSTNAEPLLVSIEINVQLEEGEGLEPVEVQESEDTAKPNSNEKEKDVDAEKTVGEAEARTEEVAEETASDESTKEKDGQRKEATETESGEKEQNLDGKENGEKETDVQPNASVGREIFEDVLNVVEKEKSVGKSAEKEKASKSSDSSAVKDAEKEGNFDGKGNGLLEKKSDDDGTPKKSDVEGKGACKTKEVPVSGDPAGEKSKAVDATADDDVEMSGDGKDKPEEIDGDGDVNMGEKDDEEEMKHGSTSPSKRVRTGAQKDDNGAATTPSVPVSRSETSAGAPTANGATGKEAKVNTGGSESSAEVAAKPLLRQLTYHTQWDVNERRLSPEEVAEGIIKASNCHPALAPKVAFSIRRQLFDVGVSCAIPPSEREKENLRKICIRVPIKGDDDTEEGVIEDKFDWDICMGEYNSAELFAQHICSDNGVSQYHVPQVAQAIRKQVMLAQAVSYGDPETVEKARKIISEDSNLNNPFLSEKMERLIHGVRRLTEAEKRELRENSIHELIMEPLFEEISDEIDMRERENLQKRIAAAKHEEEERVRKEIEKKKRRDLDAENSKLKKKIMFDADKWSNELGARIDPYLEFRLGKGNIPASLWVEGLVIRKKSGQKIMPSIPDDELKLIETPKKRKGTKGKGTGRGRGRPRKIVQPQPEGAASTSNSTPKGEKKPERKRRSSTRNAGSASKRARR